MTPEELLAEVKRYKNFIKSGGVTCTGGEPLMQPDFLIHFLQLCHEAGIHTAIDTTGIIAGDKARQALALADLILLDIKTLDDSLHPSYTGLPRTNNQATLDYLESIAKPTWLRHVVVPGYTDDDERLKALALHVSHYSCIERVEILPYHTMGRYKYEQLGIPYPLKDTPDLTAERKENAVKIFKQHVKCPVI